MSSSQATLAKPADDEIVELSETFKEQVRDLPDRLREASLKAERRSFAPRRRERED
jgi:hypothetical protein